MPKTVLYCSDPVSPNRVDLHFAQESKLVRSLGGDVRRIDHDAVLRGFYADAVRNVPHGTGAVWYRGWMIPASRYRGFYEALAERGTYLVTTPDQYCAAHEFPGWYHKFASVTPASEWTTSPTVTDIDIDRLARALPDGPAIVKDYVKSRKDHPDAFYISDVRDLVEVRRVASTFLRLQGNDLTGGLVMRAFENFDANKYRARESRVWWVDGVPVAMGPHPDSPRDEIVPEVSELVSLVGSHSNRFVTTDIARRIDGRWRLIELGDGQVSDFPSTVDMDPLIEALLMV